MIEKFLRKLIFLSLIRTCWQISPNRGRAVLIYVLLAIAHGFIVIRPLLVGKVVAALTHKGEHFFSGLFYWLGIMMAAVVVGGIFNYAGRVLQRHYALALRRKFMQTLFRQVTSLPWSWHQMHHSSDTVNRISVAADRLYGHLINEWIYLEITFDLIGSLIVLMIIAPNVGLFATAAIPLKMLVLAGFDRRLEVHTKESKLAENKLAATLGDFLGNIGSLITLRMQKPGETLILSRFDALVQPLKGEVWAGETKWYAYRIYSNLVTIGAVLLYAWTNQDKDVSVLVATSVALMQYVTTVETNARRFATNYQNLLRVQIAIDDVADIQAAAPAADTSQDGADWQTAALRGVTFRYEDREHHVHQLDGIDLDLARGRRIALVGSSGSGKSTLLRLMRGLHDPIAGTLEIDVAAQPDFMPLARMATLILQDAEIFENTLRYNIAFGIDAGDAELEPAIHMAVLAEVIDPLPEKLDTDIRERGVNLSGGQKQRLALARGLYAARDSSLLLLDEPTSSLDAITEAEVFSRLFAGLPDTCIVAAIHRLHLLDRFDHVYVMENGSVVEEGTLEELLALNGVLARLWAAQRKEEREEADA